MAKGDGDLQAAALALSRLREEAEAHPKAERLGALYREMRALREKIEEELEVLAPAPGLPRPVPAVSPVENTLPGHTPIYTSPWCCGGSLQGIPPEVTE